MKTPSVELTANVQRYVSRNRGKLYAPVPHPAFSHIRYRNGPERFDLIAPHLGYENGTVLDIGSHWGYMAHCLEARGYKVTAVEHSSASVYFMKEIRDLCGRDFEIVHDSIFNLRNLEYDIVLALNVFHHFMKDEKSFKQLDEFLGRLKCRMMIYQAHDPKERQMEGAYRNPTPQACAQFLSERLSLPHVVEIGTYSKVVGIRKLVRSYLKNGTRPKTRRLFKLCE